MPLKKTEAYQCICSLIPGQRPAISVLKANRVQGGAAINCVRREVSISVATNGTFW